MWARFTVLRDTPIDSAIAGCVIPFSRSNTIWMRWRCWGCPFQRSAVFKRRISFLVHLTTCSSESNQIRWSVRIILRLTNAIHIRIRCFATINIRFNQLWKRYKTRIRMPSKLDPHVALIEGWLAAEPWLTAIAIVGRLAELHPDQATSSIQSCSVSCEPCARAPRRDFSLRRQLREYENVAHPPGAVDGSSYAGPDPTTAPLSVPVLNIDPSANVLRPPAW